MRILFISPNLPYPPDDGGKIRIFNLIKYLSRSHEVFLICFVWEHTGETKYIREMEQYCRVVPIVRKIKGLNKLLVKLKHVINMFGFTPWMVEFLKSGEMKKKIKELQNEYKFDIAQLEYGYMAQYAAAIENVPVVVDEHNVEWIIKFQIGMNKRNIINKISNIWESLRFKAWEKKLSRYVNRYLVVSKDDRNVLEKEMKDIKTSIIENGVDTNFLKCSLTKENDKINLIFLGSMSWYPNEDAVIYFTGKIFPKITEKYPNIIFYIAGKNPSDKVRNLAKNQNIIVTGYVNDVREYFQKNVIMIVPIRIGGGTRFKIVEAMSSGIPVISTTLGCEGIEIKNRENILVADSPEEFASGIIELIENKSLRMKFRENGRKLAETVYDWEVVVKNLDKTYMETAEL